MSVAPLIRLGPAEEKLIAQLVNAGQMTRPNASKAPACRHAASSTITIPISKRYCAKCLT